MTAVLLALGPVTVFFQLGATTKVIEAGDTVLVDAIDVSTVWSGHPVGFALLTHAPYQFVAFYDAERQMTVAARTLDSETWRLIRVPERIGWDSHNYVTMTLDDSGYLHLSGNMHVRPLVYFRTTRPYDIESFTRIPGMVGSDEQRATYPQFFRGPRQELIFTYRDGSSGNGNQIYNVYEERTRVWSRLLAQPLISGEGQMNAYLEGPVAGPDGYFHLAWVWRDTPDAATNHDVMYARSKDLVHWEKSDGTALPHPITAATAEVVDAVLPRGGLINGNVKIGFDSQKRVIISYHKYDEEGITQLYNARREAEGWRIYQIGRWEYRWEFGGGGSIPFEIRVGPVRLESEGTLAQPYSHVKYGSVTLRLDEASLKPVGIAWPPPPYPRDLGRPETPFPEMQVRWAEDLGASGEPGVRYVLRWETLGPNRDLPRTPPLPPPSTLRVYKLRQ